MGKIPWRRAWQPTAVFLPGESSWTEEPVGLRSMGSQRIRHDFMAKHSTHTHMHTYVFICITGSLRCTLEKNTALSVKLHKQCRCCPPALLTDVTGPGRYCGQASATATRDTGCSPASSRVWTLHHPYFFTPLASDSGLGLGA